MRPSRSSRATAAFAPALALALGCLPARAHAAVAAHFESAPVHPLELSPSGERLFAVHTADHRLVVYDVSGPVPVRLAEIAVGIEPVGVRARTENEVWVVNHVSDSISIVDVPTGRVVRTLHVGDEPTDVVFAGSPQRAFVALSQEDRLVVFDPLDLDAVAIPIGLQGSDPRSLAVSADGTEVYVTMLDSGNETTAIAFDVVDQAGGPPPPDPPMAPGLPAPPRSALIVRHDGSTWRDETGGDWGGVVDYTLFDHDVIALDAQSLAVNFNWRGVGTHLFNVAVHPLSGDLLVTNQEAHNEIRFEPKLRGRFADQRLSVLTQAGTVTIRDLNPHVDRGMPGNPSTRASSASLPLDLVVSPGGDAIYVASFGSTKVLVLDGSGTVQRRIDVGGGPAGLALQASQDRLFVLERFASDLAWVDLTTDLVQRVKLGFDPTPVDVREGRRVFYDAANSSQYGDLSCASCHLFGGMDNLAWDLGDPQGALQPVPPFADPLGNLPPFHPMKGPMITQTLKGLTGTEPLHWRGDRAALVDFNDAFVSLMGRDAPLPPSDFANFEAFVHSMTFPGNPYRGLDDALPPSLEGGNPSAGRTLYLSGNLVGPLQCVTCHALPTGENGLVIPSPALLQDEAKVVPQLRNLYEKTRFDDEAAVNVRGFGFTHDGAVDDLLTFLDFPAFTFPNVQSKRDVVAFLLAFDTGTPAALGAQWTARGVSDAHGEQRLATLTQQADLARIDLVAKGTDDLGQARGWVYEGAGIWSSDRADEASTSTVALLALAGPGTEITFTAVWESEGVRLGIDRDEDGYLDRDEIDADSDPGNPLSVPGGGPTAADPPQIAAMQLRIDSALPARGATRFTLRTATTPHAQLDVFDLRGRRVRNVFSGPLTGGEHALRWDLRDESGRDVAAGVYLVRLGTDQQTVARRMVVLRD